MAITREQVIWVYRVILDRDPESEEVIQSSLGEFDDRIDMILGAINSEEFKVKSRPSGLIGTNESG